MSATAKLFMHGRSQAVRLPEEFRFEGTEVRISKVGDKVILEPLKKQPIDLDKFWAELDALGARDFLPDGIPDDPPVEPDPRVFFDEPSVPRHQHLCRRIVPVGQISSPRVFRLSSPFHKNISVFPKSKSDYVIRHPVPLEGRWPSSRTLVRDQ